MGFYFYVHVSKYYFRDKSIKKEKKKKNIKQKFNLED